MCKACESTINDFYNYQQRVCGNQERLTLELIKAEETALPTDIQGKDLPAVATGRDYDEGISTTDAANASDTGNSNISENAGEKFDGPDNDNISSDETEQQSLRKKSRVKKNVERKEKRKLQKKQEEDFILSVMPLTCPMCDSLSPDFDSFKAFADHFKTVHETTNWYIFCNLCRNQFRRPGHLYKHLKVHGDRNTIKCSICDKSFASNKSLAEHKKTHLPDDQKKFECEHCHRRFPNGSALAYHLENHIPVEQFQFECSQCGSTWPSKSRLNAHIHKVHSGQAFVCEICAQSYTARDGLRRHMDRKHLGKAPTQPKVKCPACDKILMNSKVFKVHFRAVHQEAGEYPCPECGHVSPNKRALKWHVEKAHKKKDIADCRACGKQMKSVRGFKVSWIMQKMDSIIWSL